VVGIGDIYGFSEAVLGGFFQGIVEPAAPLPVHAK